MGAFTVTSVHKIFRGVGDHTQVVAKLQPSAAYSETTGETFNAAALAALGLTDVDYGTTNYNGNQAAGAPATHVCVWDVELGAYRIYILEAGATATDEFANAADASALRFDVLLVGGGIVDA